MTASLNSIVNKYLPRLVDALFVLFLVTEWLYKHTFLSRAVMALFMLAIAVLILREKKLYLHPYFLFSGLLILWGLVGASWALSIHTALTMAKTLVTNLVFLLLFYQYLLLRKNGQLIQLLYMLAGVLFLALIVVTTWPDTVATRLGLEAGVNPNDVAIVAGTVFSFALARGLGEPGAVIRKKKHLFWLLSFVPMMAAVFFTASLKGYLLIFGVLCIYLLIRFPKHWGYKAAGLLLFLIALLYVLSMEGFLAHWPGIYYRITYKLQKIIEYLKGGARHRVLSIIDRTNYFAVGVHAIGRRPLTGWGLDCFRFLSGSNGTYSHNNFIELLVSGGWPMLLLYYAPILMGIVRSFRSKKRTGSENILLALVLIQLPLDFAMVSYYDRATLILPLMLFAETERNLGETDCLPRIQKYFKNPCRFIAAAGSRGKLKLLPDKLFLTLCYRGRVGQTLHLDPPATMTEKLQWMKLYDRNPLYPLLSDKLAVRKYVRDRVGDSVLVPLLGAWDRAVDVDFTALPNRFALKCTHDSGGVRVCTDKASFDKTEAVRFLEEHLAKNYYYCGREWWYKKVPPKVTAEAFIGSPDGKLPDDYKFFCFDGRVRCLLYCTNRVKAHADYYFLNPDFTLFPVNDITKAALENGVRLDPPETLPEMIRIAETLANGLSQVRVDLFDCGGRIYFGEMTLCDQSGFADDYVDGGDRIMGDFYTLPKI